MTTVGKISKFVCEFFFILVPYFRIFYGTVKIILLLLTPILCAHAYYELWVTYYR